MIIVFGIIKYKKWKSWENIGREEKLSWKCRGELK